MTTRQLINFIIANLVIFFIEIFYIFPKIHEEITTDKVVVTSIDTAEIVVTAKRIKN